MSRPRLGSAGTAPSRARAPGPANFGFFISILATRPIIRDTAVVRGVPHTVNRERAWCTLVPSYRNFFPTLALARQLGHFREGFVSTSQAVAQHLPSLRRYARALTGSQTSAEPYVAATLEALIEDPAVLEKAVGPRVALYRLFT